MTLAITLSILASFLWAVTNHIDKFLITGIDEENDNNNNIKEDLNKRVVIQKIVCILLGLAGLIVLVY